MQRGFHHVAAYLLGDLYETVAAEFAGTVNAPLTHDCLVDMVLPVDWHAVVKLELLLV